VAHLVLNEGAFFFVAGNSKQMPAEVRAALAACLSPGLGGEEAAGITYVDAMEAAGRYQTETWS
jgi:sulfite reductase alpha subunit-like flavoprotein